jgi:multiple sugar transport system substrate-binding protein
MSNKKYNRREFLKIGTLGTAGIAAAASGVKLANAAPHNKRRAAQGKVTITLWDPWSQGTLSEAANAQYKRYMDSHPNVVVQRTDIPFGDFKQKLLQAGTARELPDVVLIDNPDFHAFAALGFLQDTGELIKKWGQADQYFPGHWSAGVYQGKTYGIPVFSNCLALWVNTEDQKAAGIKSVETWDHLMAASKALTTKDRYGLAVAAKHNEEGTFQWLPFLWSAGADLATINSEGGQRALQLWVDLVKNGYMSKGIVGWAQFEAMTEFQNRRAAMMINGPWMIPNLKKTPEIKWEIAPIPKDKTGASILGGENYGVTRDSKNVEAAFDLIAWTQEPDNYKTFIKEAGMLPARKDIAKDPYWAENPELKVFVEQLAVARPRAYGEHYPEISEAIQDAMQGALTGQSSVKDALDKAQKIITPLLPASS